MNTQVAARQRTAISIATLTCLTLLHAIRPANAERLVFQAGKSCRVVSDGVVEFSIEVPENLSLIHAEQSQLVFLDRQFQRKARVPSATTSVAWLVSCGLDNKVGNKPTFRDCAPSRLSALETTKALGPSRTGPATRNAAMRPLSVPVFDKQGTTRLRNALLQSNIPPDTFRLAAAKRMAVGLLRHQRPLPPDRYWDAFVQEVLCYDFDSPIFRQVTYDEQLAMYPTPSPDGNWIAYYTLPQESNPEKLTDFRPSKDTVGAALAIVRSNGTGQRVIVPHGKNPFVQKIAWSHDGSRIYFEYCSQLNAQGRADQHVFAVSPDGTKLQCVSKSVSTGGDPSVSRDGERVVFSAATFGQTPGAPTISGIALTELTTGHTRYLVRDSAYGPKLSPSGTQVIYSALAREDRGISRLWLLDIESGRTVNLTPTHNGGTRHAFWLK